MEMVGKISRGLTAKLLHHLLKLSFKDRDGVIPATLA
jgi:hypothetical protein